MRLPILFRLSAALLLLGAVVPAQADVPQLINYQGVLLDDLGDPVTTPVNVIFAIWNAEADGDSLWSEQQAVSPNANGQFSVLLGSASPIPDSAFVGAAWLSTKVEADPEMIPRSQLVSAGYAYRVSTVDGATGGTLLDKLIVTSMGDDSVKITPIEIVIRGPGGDEQAVYAASGMTYSGTGDALTVYDSEGDMRVKISVDQEGGAITLYESSTARLPGEVNQGGRKVEFREGGVLLYGATDADTVCHLFPNGNIFGRGQLAMGDNHGGSGTWSNVAGYNNEASGDSSVVCGGYENVASGHAAAVVGGWHNIASEQYANVGGGAMNTASHFDATVGGGSHNTASGEKATVGGGWHNTANGICAAVGGGHYNEASGTSSYVGSGYSNAASGGGAVVGGGQSNTASGGWATVPGGQTNTASYNHSTVSGGYRNGAHDEYATVGGGAYNDADSASSTVGGGYRNTASHVDAVVAGGSYNTASGVRATVGGGMYDTASGAYATVPGGNLNTAGGDYATVGGGMANTANAWIATIAGGRDNSATANFAAVGGGLRNVASADCATVDGGRDNSASAWMATVGGGDTNTASGQWATVPGGRLNTASGTFSFAAGRRAKANHDGAFVWGDGTDADFASTAVDQFLIRAGGGVGINTDNPTVDLYVNGDFTVTGTCTGCSDVRYKEDIVTLDNALDKVNRMRGVNFDWRTTEYPDLKFSAKRQMGFIAQELQEIIPEVVLEADDGYLAVDYGRLTPILVEAIKDLKAESDNKAARIDRLEAQMAEMQALVQQLLAERE